VATGGIIEGIPPDHHIGEIDGLTEDQGTVVLVVELDVLAGVVVLVGVSGHFTIIAKVSSRDFQVIAVLNLLSSQNLATHSLYKVII
jgi:hypothetical protein